MPEEATMPEEEARGGREVGLQFSLYPLRQERLRPAIESAVRAAAEQGVTTTVGRLSTFAVGDEDAVFRAVRAAFDAARRHGPTVMAVTLASGPPDDQTVAEIQEATACWPITPPTGGEAARR